MPAGGEHPWAALNGALALAAHPIRRTLVSADPADLYRATFELCLKGLAERSP